MAAVVVLERSRVLRLRVRLQKIEIELHAADEIAERLGVAAAEVGIYVQESHACADVRLHARRTEVPRQIEVGSPLGDIVDVPVFDRSEEHTSELQSHSFIS